MSKIGKKNILIPKDSSIKIEGEHLTISGPKGTKKLTINDKIFSSKYCKKKFIPFVSISINSSDGIYFSQNYKYNNKASSCFECLFPQTEQNHRCLNSAMIGPVAGFVTSLACTRIIFALANQNLKLKNEINLIDLLTSDINKLQLKKISCPH